ncbi:MAG TPA: zinc dependent phospholipase C family protein [Candidatus Binatia bacterium]|nr:zinc dependent phospholipase C family protein [Candidatus Binatia bacterium]
MKVAAPPRSAATLCSLLLAWLLVFPPRCAAYSVLTHEQIIDLLWDQQIRALLLARFPGASHEDLRKAHAYAYGGSVIQDIGYYPFGNHFFSDLTHYVRTGDFVLALLRDSQDLNEYAFALGALSHYISDIHGHPYINLAVGIEYPALAQLYGPSVPYDVDHKAHLRTEFGFDVLQVAKGRYASEDYHNFIGFEVSAPLLERAFQDTYGLKLTEVMPNEQLAINTYRRSISQIIPEMTKVALLVKGDQLKREIPDFNRQHFLYHMSKADYQKHWGGGYKQPGPGAHILAAIFKVVPKVGPLRAIDFREPTAKTEDMYFRSVDETIDRYHKALQQVRAGDLQAPEIDLDTGKPTRLGEYPLADATYRELLDELAGDNFLHIDDALRQNILSFYEGFDFPQPGTRIDKCVAQRWSQTWVELARLRSIDLAQAQ